MNAARWTSAALCLFACLAAPAQTAQLGAQIMTLLADPSVSRAHWGIAVTAIDGTPIYGLDDGKLFRPASTAKLFTTTAAMAMLGPEATTTIEARFQPPSAEGVSGKGLRISARGYAHLSPIPDSSAASSADPLSNIDLLSQKIASAGVRRILGDVVWSDPLWADRYPEGWSSEDSSEGYGAPVASISLNNNESVVILSEEYLWGYGHYGVTSAQVLPDVGYFRIADKMHQPVDITMAPADVGVTIDPSSSTILAYGHVPPPATTPPLSEKHDPGFYRKEIAVDDPAKFAAQALIVSLRQHGVEVEGVAKSSHGDVPTMDFLRETKEAVSLAAKKDFGGPLMCSGCGPALPGTEEVVYQPATTLRDADIHYTLKQSQNLHAEFLLLGLGQALGKAGKTVEGVRVVRQYLINAGIDPDDFVFYDGSGLSVKDLVTPRAEAQLLAYAAKQPWFAQWKPALPVGGVDGTLEHRFTEAPLKGHVFAKTGTLGESRALAGYVDCASGKQVIFSIMVDNHTPGSSADRMVMDKIVAAIAANN